MKQTILLFLLLPAWVSADQVCDELLALERSWNADMPKPIDEYTELVQIIVNCQTETVAYKKRILVPGNLLPSGIKARKQRQHTQLHCNNKGLSSQSKWTAMDVVYDFDYEYLFTLTTAPTDCNSSTGESQ